mmetsp:Transcript_34644/g.54096  ORF Transcript_34644/g.54096 Transcript_34644/m.54096 type:complete len:214 (-) Transcript_34644:165-806(-)|eukprot:CAMPEP_0184287996 /NCGR_PEP_ID=MMETSP1049-20130417/419_1 /TAXON_ID=77928 /ORGANISM="Proteomonas sulcata, Strain CCMP704" /LENGTH=213 /DNA_ID=CAMNT_0026594143 /DNA_START=677 /DNA_END=1318 /DNA_ORIENTATION=+
MAAPVSGFRAVPAETRADRMSRGDKDALEKQRLKARTEGYQRYQDPGQLTELKPGALGFQSDAERFQTGAHIELKRNRDAVIQQRENKYDMKRDQYLTREEDRWQKADDEMIQDAEKRYIQHIGSKGSYNHSSVAYDFVSMEYHDSDSGMRQQYEDNLARYRAGVRTEKLHRQSSGDGFNPITGQELRPPAVPPKPQNPLVQQQQGVASTRPW